jgi:serine/threonine protein kinase
MLHNIGYAHRDIKPENYIKVGEDWKLCDFGLTIKHNQDLMTKNIGSILYTAPEVLTNNYESYTEKIDVWSIGCLMYEII